MNRTLSIILIVLLIAVIIVALILFSKNSDLSAQLKAKERLLADLESKVTLLEKDLARVKDALGKAPRPDEVAELEDKVRKLEDELARAEKATACAEELDRLKKDLAGEKEARAGLEKELAKEKEARAGLEKEVTREKEARAGLEKELAGLKAQAPGPPVGPAEPAEPTDCTELEKQLAEKEARLGELGAQVDKLQAMVESLKAGGPGDEGKIKELLAEVQALQAELAELSGEKEKTAAELSDLKKAYETMVADLKKEIENKEVTISQIKENLSITFVDSILFESGHARITPEGRRTLTKVGQTLGGIKDRRIMIVGHTDSQNISRNWQKLFPTNWELSTARAVAVTRFFIDQGLVDPAVLEAAGRSFYAPVADNDSEEGRARNRRVEIIIAPRPAGE
ncbi:MAG: OmpA family protein [Thermodesulfobacteriota bacterium]